MKDFDVKRDNLIVMIHNLDVLGYSTEKILLSPDYLKALNQFREYYNPHTTPFKETGFIYEKPYETHNHIKDFQLSLRRNKNERYTIKA